MRKLDEPDRRKSRQEYRVMCYGRTHMVVVFPDDRVVFTGHGNTTDPRVIQLERDLLDRQAPLLRGCVLFAYLLLNPHPHYQDLKKHLAQSRRSGAAADFVKRGLTDALLAEVLYPAGYRRTSRQHAGFIRDPLTQSFHERFPQVLREWRNRIQAKYDRVFRHESTHFLDPVLRLPG